MTAAKRIYAGLTGEERRARRREKLLEAGLELLGTEGWQATTVTAVCEHARLTPRYFYESFRDRDDLLVAIFDRIVEQAAEEARQALATTSGTTHDTVRATMAAWIRIATEDPRKGRVAFVEALGSETLMRRRLDTMRRFAKFLSNEARAAYNVSARGSGPLDVAGLIVAGGLIETMIEWLEGRLDRPAEDLIEDYTKLCTASLEAAIPERAT